MQVKKIIIDDYKCLVDFRIDFNICDGGSSTILIGENGTGKSSLLEAIMLIIMSFDSPTIEKNLPFSYELDYLYAGKTIVINGNNSGVHIIVDRLGGFVGKAKTVIKKLAKDNISILPERINLFYSGSNNKLLDETGKMNSSYRKKCIKTLREYVVFIQSDGLKYNKSDALNSDKIDMFELPRMKYMKHSTELDKVCLCAILCGQESYEKNYLIHECNIGSFAYIDVELNLSVVANNFLDYSYDKEMNLKDALKIIEFIDYRFVELFERHYLYNSYEKFYFAIRDIEALGLDKTDIYNFFEKLHTIFSSKFNVALTKGISTFKSSTLSEGQHQMIRVVATTGLYKGEDSLVLMDEPDAHMNPKWKYGLKSVIDSSLKSATNTQALIATHDPLLINGVDKEYIRILHYNASVLEYNNLYIAKCSIPNDDTKGMGIDGLLQSEYYGLKTSYDKETSDKYQKRQELYIKLINKEITDEEKVELRDLTKEIGSLPVANNTIDFLYDDFIKVYRSSKYYLEDYLSKEEMSEREEYIRGIISDLFEDKV